MLVKKDDQSSEQAMQGHWQYDGRMNGALDKTKGKWPSSVQVSNHANYPQQGGFGPSRLLSG